jgi:hypothetical protein
MDHEASTRKGRRPIGVAAPFLLLPALALGCGSDGSLEGFEGLPWAAAEPLVRIGSVDDADFAFDFVGAIEVTPDGHLLSLHPREPSIRRWTPEGRPAGTIGRRGEGPGEFSRPQTMGWVADTLWVMDLAGYRFNFYSANGNFIRSVNPPVDIGSTGLAEDGVLPPRPHRLLEDGTVWSRSPAFSQAIMEGTLNRVLHTRTGPDGSLLDTLLVQPVSTRGSLGVPFPGGGGMFTSQPFNDEVRVEGLPDGSGLLILAPRAATDPASAEFALTRVGLSGDTVFHRAYPYTPVPVPRNRADSIVEATAERFHESMGEQTGIAIGEWRRLVRDALYVPAHYPPVGTMVAGRDGSIWLSLRGEAADPTDPGRSWVVLDPDGEPLHRIRIPEGTRIVLAERDGFWAIVRDDLDVEYITRFRVGEGEGG